MPNTYSLISSNTVSTATASVTFSSIPATFTDLLLKVSSRSNDASYNSAIIFRFDGDTSTNYSVTTGAAYQTNRIAYRDSGDTSLNDGPRQPGNGTYSSLFGNIELYIPNYTVAQFKPMSSLGTIENYSEQDFYLTLSAGLWRNTSAIDTILIYNAGANTFVAGSSFYLYGIKNS